MPAEAGPVAPLHLHLDALGGIAGDMLVAALLDARPELEDPARALAAGIGPGVVLVREEASDGGLRGSRLRLTLPTGGHGPHHYPQYRDLLADLAPDPGTARRATDILRRLGEAEARVHGVTLEQVHFHEIADWDSVADILLAAWALERLGLVSASAAPVPLGSGRVQTDHGPMPVPAPATTELLRGLPVIDDGIAGERVTPTGAAILAHLRPFSTLPAGTHRLVAQGYGMGRRSLKGIANALRAVLYAPAGPGSDGRDAIGIIRFAVDYQTPEGLAVGLDRVRTSDGVRNVLQAPAFGKNGRMTIQVEVLCAPEKLDEVARLCLYETTTIAVRLSEERCIVLAREAGTAGGTRVKQVERLDGRQSL